jgi:tetratricopeptide (TPR) repeat protein
MAGIKPHLEKCRVCQQKVDAITQEFRAIAGYLEQAGVPPLAIGRKPLLAALEKQAAGWFRSVSSFLQNLFSLPAPKFYPVAAAALAGVLILIWLSPLFRGSDYKYHQLAALEIEKVAFLSRDANTQGLSDGLYAFEQGQYAQALEKLERFIADSSEHRSVEYSHYVAGLAYLLQAQSDFLGRFQKYDSSFVHRGIRHLQAAIRHSDNLRIREDAYWFIGKAHLMEKNGRQALEAFKKVEELKGRRSQEAQKIIVELDLLAKQAGLQF